MHYIIEGNFLLLGLNSLEEFIHDETNPDKVSATTSEQLCELGFVEVLNKTIQNLENKKSSIIQAMETELKKIAINLAKDLLQKLTKQKNK